MIIHSRLNQTHFRAKKGFLILVHFNFSHFSRTSSVKIFKTCCMYISWGCSYITHVKFFYLDASFWIFSHLLICNFNAKLKMISPFYHAYFEKGSNRKITKLCMIYIYISVLRSMCYNPSYIVDRLKLFVSN